MLHAGRASLATHSDMLATDAAELLKLLPPLLPQGQGKAVAATCSARH